MAVDDRVTPAEERTQLAEKRTVLAVERNFSAWIRTGLASVAAGFAVVKLTTETDPAWLVHTLGITFTISGGAMIAMGYWRYHRETLSPDFCTHQVFPRWAMPAVAVSLIAGAVVALALILLSMRN